MKTQNFGIDHTAQQHAFFVLIDTLSRTEASYELDTIHGCREVILACKGSVPSDWHKKLSWSTIMRTCIVMGWSWPMLDGKIKNALRFLPITLSIEDVNRNTELFKQYPDSALWSILLDVRPESEIYFGLSVSIPFDIRIQQYHTIFDVFFHYEMCRRYRQEGWNMLGAHSLNMDDIMDNDMLHYQRVCMHMYTIEELYAYLSDQYVLNNATKDVYWV